MTSESSIAVVGCSMSFPGAQNLNEYWKVLSTGSETIQFFTKEEMLEAGVKESRLSEPNYIRAKGTIKDAEYFDAELFGISPERATVMDPQHRVFIQKSWEALEDAGYDPIRFEGSIGLFGGCAINTYLLNNLRHADRALTRKFHQIEFLIMTDKDFLTTQTSYLLGLHGPSVTIQTACSTGLVSIHYACESLLSGESDLALAGAATVYAPQVKGYLYEEGSIVSDDGHIRSFDAKGKGTVYSSGAGVLALKRLSDAISDNDTILTVIRSTAINNDGARKGGFRMPSAEGIAEAAIQALSLADVEPSEIGMIEANGSATPLGDPIEIEALKRAYGREDLPPGAILIGSVKSNLGHMNVTAGIGAFLKTALSLKYGKIPESLNYETPNPQINFEQTPFEVSTKLQDWPISNSKRIAGLNVYGVGGTNAHAILQEPPNLTAHEIPNVQNHLLMVSAATRTALESSKERLGIALNKKPEIYIGNAAYTLCVGRRRMKNRSFGIGSITTEGHTKIDWFDNVELSDLEAPCTIILPEPADNEEYLQFKHYQAPLFVENLKHAANELPELFAHWRNSKPLSAELKPLSNFVQAWVILKTLMDYGVKIQSIIGERSTNVAASALAVDLPLITAAEACRTIFCSGVKSSTNNLDQFFPTQLNDGAAFSVLTAQNKEIVSSSGHIDLSLMLSENQLNQLSSHRMGSSKTVFISYGASTTSSPSDIVFSAQSLNSSAEIIEAVGNLWCQGVDIGPGKLYGQWPLGRVPLPTYPFARNRYWVDIPSDSKRSNYDVAL